MSVNDGSSFGSWIQARRRFLGLTQDQLGNLINYSSIAIRKLESGTRPCSEELAILLVRILEVPAQHQSAFMRSARTGWLEPTLQPLAPAENGSSAAAQSASTSMPDPSSVLMQDLSQYAQPTTQLFGREVDIAQVEALLQQSSVRLITLHGAPGVGKSRLSVEVLRRANSLAWPDGNFFVPLAHIDHETLIPEAIAAAMGIHGANTGKWRNTVASQSVYQFVKSKQALLVLDNFEHLQGGVSFLLELLAAAPLIKVIVTSRSRLEVSAETLFPVKPLKVLDVTALTPLSQVAQNAAVALFVARAQSRRHSFQLTQDNSTTVVELCQRLGGLPLALELAAVRLKLQTPAELLGQFKALPQPNSMRQSAVVVNSNTLQMLNHGTKDMPQRHHSLLGALNWSYDLLTPDAQSMFDQLGVFHGGFTREAALAVTQGSLKSLEELASQSLIQVQTSSDQGIRLDMLEVMREFALVKLEARGETHSIQQRHAQYLASLLQRLDNNSPDQDELDSVEIISAEYANMRAALSWCLDHDLRTGFTLARYMNPFWQLNGSYDEGRTWTTQMLAAGERSDVVSPESRAYLLCVGKMLYTDTPLAVIEEQRELFRRLGIKDGMALAEGILGWTQMRSSPARAEHHLGVAVAILEADGPQISWFAATLRMFRAMAMYNMGEFAISMKLLNEAIQIHTQSHGRRWLAHTQNYLAWLHFMRGDLEAALQLANQVLVLNQQIKDSYSLGRALVTKAFAELKLGQITLARTSVADGLQVANETSANTLRVFLLHAAGELAFWEGDFVEASQLYVQSITLSRQMDQTDTILLNLVNMAQLALTHVETHPSVVVQWLSAVKTIALEMKHHLPVSHQLCLDQTLGVVRTRLDEESFAAAQMLGKTLSLDAAIALAQTATENIAVEVEAG